ncbi:MAG TPA: DUF742 domain-containing protein [Actinophytocola sp.]|uniref:DUF742 domain-containing protein n=1 Tax=Actinophytocola sp. TaxID=1872138 RepID=UPI002DB7BBD7|nr:DUF742 domain-containing protein [Actinophytocola sp.]HEU5475505.1 DUF742 domain-containing protein [Actinophytocola sp.]
MTESEPYSGRHSRPGLARPYSFTEGRTEPSVEIAIEAQVQTTRAGYSVPPNATSPQWNVLQLCYEARSVAEIAAHMSVPPGVVKVLVADLLNEGLVVVHATLGEDTTLAERRELIERVLSGLRAQ